MALDSGAWPVPELERQVITVADDELTAEPSTLPQHLLSMLIEAMRHQQAIAVTAMPQRGWAMMRQSFTLDVVNAANLGEGATLRARQRVRWRRLADSDAPSCIVDVGAGNLTGA